MTRERTHRRRFLTREGPGARDMRKQDDFFYSHRARMAARARAKRWTQAQAYRLRVSPEDILEAIKRGVLADVIAVLEPDGIQACCIFCRWNKLAA